MAQNKRAERVWDYLIRCYGTRVADSYGPTMPRPWVEAVEDLTDDQIAFGLKAVLKLTPVHPPTLGQFREACANMPVAPQKQLATLQEQLVEYVKTKTPGRLVQSSRPWTYLYREWWDATRPKGMERCAECTAVRIEIDNGDVLTFRVADMLSDPAHKRVMQMFLPGPHPKDRQAQKIVRD